MEAAAHLVETMKMLYDRVSPWFRTKRVAAAPSVDYTNDFIDEILEIRDTRGREAQLTKRQRVRITNDGGAVLRDVVWGTGRPLARYMVRGARKLGLIEEGTRRTVLLRIEPPPSQGQTHNVRVQRLVKGAFIDDTNYFELLAERPTRRMSLRILFPRGRPPKTAHLVLSPAERTLKPLRVRYTKNRQPYLSWRAEDPQMMTAYSLRWAW
jgi:hypothetical protein